MKTKELRGLKPEELEKKIAELRKEIIKINGQVSTGTAIKSPGQLKNTKKNIARILTVLNEKSTIKQQPQGGDAKTHE